MFKAQVQLDADTLVKFVQPDGILGKTLKGFESREAQQMMLKQVVGAYNNNRIALVEAGTGTGKSLAYLIPALIWAVNNGEATVISTHTIALQEQLVLKDIPLLSEKLNLPVKAVLVKGMGNYLCIRKLKELRSELNLFSDKEAQELQVIEAWSDSTADGSRSTLPIVPSYSTWEQVCAEADTCNNNQCPYYKECFFFKARQEAAGAHLMVANHALLFSDLASRSESGNYDQPCILPPYKRVVLDEAHHIEEIATEYFASKISLLGMMRILSRLASEKAGMSKKFEQGKVPMLKSKFNEIYGKDSSEKTNSIRQRLTTDLNGLRADTLIEIGRTFAALEKFLNTFAHEEADGPAPNPDSKLRLLEKHLTHPLWKEEVQSKVKLLKQACAKYAVALGSLDKDIADLKDNKLNDATKSIRFDINALAGRLQNASLTLEDFAASTNLPDRVRWLESHFIKGQSNVHIINADLDVSRSLANGLFTRFSSIILCSATLTTNQQFSFIRQRLGIRNEWLDGREVTENIFESPFDYARQALLTVPVDAPNPTHPDFFDSVIDNTWRALQASRGNAFILFTSYKMLEKVYTALADRLKENRFFTLKQGDENRLSLLERFKTQDRSILFGTDSFWEGVDVVGEALRCVIIVKLPFQVPSEPLIEARTELIRQRGGEPFIEYAVPNAIVKFKQGFGRLIRNRKDRGCIVCLDPRLITKPYGRLFLNSLPNCQQLFKKGEFMQEGMEEFYKKTYRLTKENNFPEKDLERNGIEPLTSSMPLMRSTN